MNVEEGARLGQQRRSGRSLRPEEVGAALRRAAEIEGDALRLMVGVHEAHDIAGADTNLGGLEGVVIAPRGETDDVHRAGATRGRREHGGEGALLPRIARGRPELPRSTLPTGAKQQQSRQAGERESVKKRESTGSFAVLSRRCRPRTANHQIPAQEPRWLSE